MIAADDLSLIPVTLELKRTFARSREAFGQALGLRLLDGWPQFPEALDPRGLDLTPPWGGYLFAVGEEVVGNGGFVGLPDTTGCVEIGYEIAPARWSRGYATTAARSLLRLAWENGASGVIAHSPGEWNASNRVMAKLGMRFVDALPSAELGTVWRFLADYVPPPDANGGC